MAEQARKFGARVAELRADKHWKQRDLVAAMAELGDLALNTNQLSRYENGGAMPSEQRQVWFAEALDTSVADLVAGPIAERAPRRLRATDPFAANGDSAAPDSQMAELRRQLEALRVELLAELARVRTEQAGLRRLLQPGERSPAAPRS